MNNVINQIKQFLTEAYLELKKVSWLSKKEVVASTVVVIILVLLVALYVGLIDFLLSRVLTVIL
jgi:preprotein translocase subunit SecE